LAYTIYLPFANVQKREEQLSQKDRATLSVIEYFTGGHSI